MSARYRYRKLSGLELSRELSDLGLTVRQFSRLTGVQPRTTERYLQDPDADIPHWIRVFLKLLQLPGNMEKARAITDMTILDETYE